MDYADTDGMPVGASDGGLAAIQVAKKIDRQAGTAQRTAGAAAPLTHIRKTAASKRRFYFAGAAGPGNSAPDAKTLCAGPILDNAKKREAL